MNILQKKLTNGFRLRNGKAYVTFVMNFKG